MMKGQGWTLIARVSNKETKLYWRPRSSWWNDTKEAKGETTNPLDDMDMISPAFWLVGGNEFMITRSDNPHTALLQTTDDCLGKQTFRDKIKTSLDGGFETNHCKRSCEVTYEGNYKNTKGFQHASNSHCPQSGQSRDKIGFWCKHCSKSPRHFTWAVMMIGAGGDISSRADHGIGIRRKAATEGAKGHNKDFGDNVEGQPIIDYSLNLWVWWSFELPIRASSTTNEKLKQWLTNSWIKQLNQSKNLQPFFSFSNASQLYKKRLLNI